jgi:hypothetical protein
MLAITTASPAAAGRQRLGLRVELAAAAAGAVHGVRSGRTDATESAWLTRPWPYGPGGGVARTILSFFNLL